MFRTSTRPTPTRALTSAGIFIALLAVVFAGESLVSQPVLANDPTTVAVLKRVEAKSRAVAARSLGATVGIINQSLAGNGRLGEGSGVVVSEDGLIVTVGHVIAKPGSELTVIFPDGRRATAKALGANFARDSGLAKITEPGKWPHVEMGHSDDIKPGTWCMALGHPGGIQQGRTPPIRLGRVLNAGKDAKFLVTDATVISGDSGGPLVRSGWPRDRRPFQHRHERQPESARADRRLSRTMERPLGRQSYWHSRRPARRQRAQRGKAQAVP